MRPLMPSAAMIPPLHTCAGQLDWRPAVAKRRKRRDKSAPTIGGVVGEDTTKQARRRRARRDAAEMTKLARKQLKIPTAKEVMEIERTKER